MTSPIDPATVRRAILSMAGSRGPGKTFCPSEVARQLADDWHPLMGCFRGCVRKLAREGRLRVSQRGRVLSPEVPWHGAIRLQAGDHSNGE
ncbi:DUF3253 domain-containing protein [Salinicola halimionae]|uniref:DUF3253 domain-containing protein n=1 Tax=Salinicola halimionae TaxID=1949081 RepID=UPI000DA2634A